MGSKYLKTLPQYHFDRNEFVDAFCKVFTNDEIIDIECDCSCYKVTDEFIFYRWEDEFYIIHRVSGTMINWYKHLGRTNTCNKEGFSLDDLREFLLRLRADLNGEVYDLE